MKSALGKGLEALLPEKGDEVIKIEIAKIVPNVHQPRKIFKDEALQELAHSIQERGVLQPLIVSRVGDGTFRLIAGERRWRAAQLAGLKKVPALVKEVSSQDALEIALIENIQREELNPIETAEAFEHLMKEFNMTQDALSERVGKDRATIANYLRLLRLPDEIKEYINAGSISMGHAKALLSLETKQQQIEAAKRVMKHGLSVRATEAYCKKSARPAAKTKKTVRMPEVIELEHKLAQSLGTKVMIHHKDKKGSIEIEYYSLDELDRLIEILMK
jgi:ParB family chromosome partitioning protein